MGQIRVESVRPNFEIDRLKNQLAQWTNAFAEYGDNFNDIKRNIEENLNLKDAEIQRLQFELNIARDCGDTLDQIIDDLVQSYDVMKAGLEQGGYDLAAGNEIELLDQRRIVFNVSKKLATYNTVSNDVGMSPALTAVYVSNAVPVPKSQPNTISGHSATSNGQNAIYTASSGGDDDCDTDDNNP